MNKKTKTILSLIITLFLIPLLLVSLSVLIGAEWYAGVIPYFLTSSIGIGTYIVGVFKWGPWWLYD